MYRIADMAGNSRTAISHRRLSVSVIGLIVSGSERLPNAQAICLDRYVAGALCQYDFLACLAHRRFSLLRPSPSL